MAVAVGWTVGDIIGLMMYSVSSLKPVALIHPTLQQTSMSRGYHNHTVICLQQLSIADTNTQHSHNYSAVRLSA